MTERKVLQNGKQWPQHSRIWKNIRTTFRAVPILASSSRRYSYSKNDSPTQQYGESATLRINDTRSRRLSDSTIRGVDDSPHHWHAESASEFFKRKLTVSVIRRVIDSAYRWYGESPTPRIVESGSRRLRVSVIRGVASLASIFSTLNGWSMPLKDQFFRKLARDVLYYQNRII